MFTRIPLCQKVIDAATPFYRRIMMQQSPLLCHLPKPHPWNFTCVRSFAKKKIMHPAARRQRRKLRKRRLQRREHRKLMAELRGETPPKADPTLYNHFRSWMEDPVPLRLEKFVEAIATYLSQDLLPRFPRGFHLTKLQLALLAFNIRVPHPEHPGRFVKRQYRPGRRNIHEILPVIGVLERRGLLYTKMSVRGKMIIFLDEATRKENVEQTDSLFDLLKDMIKIARIGGDNSDEETLNDGEDRMSKKDSVDVRDSTFEKNSLSDDNPFENMKLDFDSVLPLSELDIDLDNGRPEFYDSDNEYTHESAYDIPTRINSEQK